MNPTHDHTHELFANTGIQIVYQELPADAAARLAKQGASNTGWRYCLCQYTEEGPPQPLPYVQWQAVNSKFFLAVDTTLGDKQLGHLREDGGFSEPLPIVIRNLLGPGGEIIKGLPEILISIQPGPKNGTPKDCHLVIDFGNSRTGALLMELKGKPHVSLEMQPFELVNRFKMDAWSEGEFQFRHEARWFSSQTTWSTPPYLRPREVEVVDYVYPEKKGGLFSKKGPETVIRIKQPRLFDDLSMVRLGKECEDTTQLMRGDVCSTLSSPKRYLWADDADWLEGAHWSMAKPYDNHEPRTYFEDLNGPLLGYLDSNDGDEMLEEDYDNKEFASHLPMRPHVPRSLMVAALYEILCQAYTFANSLAYRLKTGDPNRPRVLSSVTLTYPSGMVLEERERFRRQAQKAIRIFQLTLGKKQEKPPDLKLSIDEASAVQLTYIWGELQMLGLNPELWFSAMTRDRGETAPAEDEPEPEPAPSVAPFPGGLPGGFPGAFGGGSGKKKKKRAATSEETAPQLRIACIDIGGGTTDLMIAGYTYSLGTTNKVLGEILHRDGISTAGDKLAERLLGQLIVPAFAEAVGLDAESTEFLFGEETPNNRSFRVERINWMKRIFLPLAHKYLDCAVLEDEHTNISHYSTTLEDARLVDPDILKSLEQVIAREPPTRSGQYNFETEMDLRYDPKDFEPLTFEVFGRMLYDFCTRIIDHKADVVLLAGQPTKLKYLQGLVRMYLPLHESRVIPMHRHYAGSWYPYQDAGKSGVIVDPKSAVVVGAALELVADRGRLPQFGFRIQPAPRGEVNRYYWGLVNPAAPQILRHSVWFRGDDSKNRIKVAIDQPELVIGRKLYAHDHAEAAPIYILQVLREDESRRIDITVEIERAINPADPTEEVLRLLSAEGYVEGPEKPAIVHENVRLKVRTLGDKRFFLDTGGLDKIDVSALD